MGAALTRFFPWIAGGAIGFGAGAVSDFSGILILAAVVLVIFLLLKGS